MNLKALSATFFFFSLYSNSDIMSYLETSHIDRFLHVPETTIS